MEFLPGFKWSIPMAFAPALGSCFFDQGDILYSSADGYLPAYEAKNTVYYLQVQDIYQGSATGNFGDNWYASAKVILSTQKQSIKTTQGNIFKAIWTGDLQHIFNPSASLPPCDVTRLFKCFVRQKEHINVSPHETIFLMPYDPTSSLFREKRTMVETALKDEFEFKSVEALPTDVIASNFLCENYSPLSRIMKYTIESSDLQSIQRVLKAALYAPTKNRITDADRFKLDRHGLLIEGREKEN